MVHNSKGTTQRAGKKPVFLLPVSGSHMVLRPRGIRSILLSLYSSRDTQMLNGAFESRSLRVPALMERLPPPYAYLSSLDLPSTTSHYTLV